MTASSHMGPRKRSTAGIW